MTLSWGSGLEFGSRCPGGVARLYDVEPLLLPPFNGLHEGAYWPCGVGHLAHHGASALRVLTAHDLWLHIEDL